MNRWRLLGAALASVIAPLSSPPTVTALAVQEAILLARPAVVLVRVEVRAEVTINCGTGPVTVQPLPFLEIGTGWFVDGRGYLLTNAHVADPAHRVPGWMTAKLKKKAIEQACVEPVLPGRGFRPGQHPDLEDQIRRDATDCALATGKVATMPQITVLLSSGVELTAEVNCVCAQFVGTAARSIVWSNAK